MWGQCQMKMCLLRLSCDRDRRVQCMCSFLSSYCKWQTINVFKLLQYAVLMHECLQEHGALQQCPETPPIAHSCLMALAHRCIGRWSCTTHYHWMSMANG